VGQSNEQSEWVELADLRERNEWSQERRAGSCRLEKRKVDVLLLESGAVYFNG
jgi:hypothetical protein